MKFKSFFLCTLALISGTILYSDTVDETDSSQFINQKDMEALREWLATKRQVSVKQMGGDLSISGEVRVELQDTSEVKNGVKQRGPNSANPGVPNAAYDIEVNLMLDYRTDTNWASIKLEFDNNAGNNLNIFDSITIERAIFGLRVINRDTVTVDVEAGRRSMGNVFDSNIEFGSFLDGILLKYDLASDKLGDFYIHAAPFLVNEQRYQWGIVGETGLLNIFNTGLYAKYSIIDWDTKNLKSSLLAQQFRFINSQWILGYKFVPKLYNKVTTLYSAFLVNTAAKPVAQTNYTKANIGWYAGFSVGKVRKKYDWSIDVNYQYVQAQAVPDFDASGIGRGNYSKVGLYNIPQVGKPDIITTVDTAVGKANYQGIVAQLVFLLTDTVTVFQSFSHSTNANDNIGPKINFNQYEIEFIYAF
jgi:hypothetical protein